MRFLVLLLTLSIAAPTDAAINMLGSADAKVSFGDVTMGGETAVTVAVTVLVAGAFVGAGDRFVSKWGNSSGEQSFVLYRPGNNNINFLVSNAANVYGCGTTDTPLSGTPLLVRIVATITLDPKTCRIWVNGAERFASYRAKYGVIFRGWARNGRERRRCRWRLLRASCLGLSSARLGRHRVWERHVAEILSDDDGHLFAATEYDNGRIARYVCRDCWHEYVGHRRGASNGVSTGRRKLVCRRNRTGVPLPILDG
jgi:hypothetical protein